MSQTTITVAGINPPELGKKQGKIVDTAGNKWNVWGDKIASYRMGVTYDIVYETNEFKDTKFNVIKTANPSNAAPQPARQAPRSSDDWPGPQPSVAMPQHGNPKDEMIFVCGIINNAMSNPNVNPFETTLTELIAMVDKARSAWRNTLGKSQKSDDMRDEIPL